MTPRLRRRVAVYSRLKWFESLWPQRKAGSLTYEPRLQRERESEGNPLRTGSLSTVWPKCFVRRGLHGRGCFRSSAERRQRFAKPSFPAIWSLRSFLPRCSHLGRLSRGRMPVCWHASAGARSRIRTPLQDLRSIAHATRRQNRHPKIEVKMSIRCGGTPIW